MIKRSAINEKELLERFGLEAIRYYTGYNISEAIISKNSLILYDENREKIDVGNFLELDEIDQQMELL